MNNSEIRQEARYVLKGNWVNASLTLFLYGVLSSIGFIIALVAGGMFSALTSMGDLSRISSGSENLSPEDQMAVLSFYGKFMGAYAVGYILLFVGIGLFTLGLYKIFLGVARGEGANIGDLFKSCKYIFKVIVWIVRGIPLMLQIFIIYYLPGLLFHFQLFGQVDRFFLIEYGIMDAGRIMAVLIAFTVNYACYFSEIYRGGIESISKGQYEAGYVLGLTKSQIFKKIILIV